MIIGKVIPPDDLQPAIDALSEAGRSYLYEIADGETITPHMIVEAADWERDGQSQVQHNA